LRAFVDHLDLLELREGPGLMDKRVKAEFRELDPLDRQVIPEIRERSD